MHSDTPGRPAANQSRLLHDGINAARLGRRERARDLLLQVVQHDEGNLQAWLWLSSVVDELEEREICLENVLTLDPDNEAAQRGLALLCEHRERTDFSVVGEDPAQPVTAQTEIVVAHEQPAPLTAMDMPSTSEVFDESYLCPYCAAPTHHVQRKCSACGGALWVRSWRQEQKTSHHRMALTLQAVCAALTTGGALGMLIYVARRVGFDDLSSLAGLYLGLVGDIPSEVVTAALDLVPRSALLGLILLGMLSLVALVGLLFRWKPAFYLFLLNGAGLGVVGTLVTRVLWEVAIGAGDTITLISRAAMILVDVAVVLVAFGLAMEIREDFFFEQDRILFRLDRGTVSGADFIIHAQRHAREGRWALAAIHFKRAVDQLPNDLGAHLGLAASYTNLGRHNLAEKYLAEAQRIRPNDPRLEEVSEWMKRKRARDGGLGRSR